MNVRFCVDESTGKAVANYLRDQGYDVWSVIESAPGIDDSEILQKSHSEHRILVTNDKDFGELVFRHKMPVAGVILLRLLEETPANKVRVVEAVLDRWGTDLKGFYITATESIIRRRKLPDS